jgi:hypothetical protein
LNGYFLRSQDLSLSFYHFTLSLHVLPPFLVKDCERAGAGSGSGRVHNRTLGREDIS